MNHRLESGDAEPSEHSAYRRLHLRVDFSRSFVDGCEHHVLQHLHVARFHRFRIDAQTEQLLAPIHLGSDGSSTGRGFDNRLLHLLLQRVVLRFSFRHQFLQIESAHSTPHFQVSTFQGFKVARFENVQCLLRTMNAPE